MEPLWRWQRHSRVALAQMLLVTAAVFVLTGCGSGAGTMSSSDAACAAPEVTLSATEAAAGTALMLTGQNFVDECDDTGQEIEVKPLKDVVGVFAQVRSPGFSG